MHTIRQPLARLSAVLALTAAACGPADVGELTVTFDPPAGVVADGRTTVKVTATAKDAAGQPVEGLAIEFLASGGHNAFTPDNATGTTAKDGTFSVELATTEAGDRAVTATTHPTDPKKPPASTTETITFTAGEPIAAESKFDLPRTEIRADGDDHVFATVSLFDANRNPVPAVALTFSATGAAALFEPAEGVVTDTSGRARVSISATQAGDATLSVTAGTLTLTRRVSFVAAEPDATHCVVTVPESPTVADGVDVAILRFVIKDAQGNLVPNAAVEVSADASQELSFRGLTSGTTDEAGEFSTRVTGTLSGTRRVTARVGRQRFTLFALPVFAPGPVSPTTSTLAVDGAAPVADGFAVGRVLFTALDQFGNAVPGVNVDFTAPEGSTPATASATTVADGTALYSFSSAAAGAIRVQASAAGVSLTVDVPFLPGALDTTRSSITARPAPVVADGATQAALEVALVDALGNGIPGLPVTLSSTEAGVTFGAAGGDTDGSGALVTTIRSSKAGVLPVVARVGDVVVARTVTFVPGPASANTSTFEITPQPLPAGDEGAVAVVARDSSGNPIAGVAVRFTITRDGTDAITPRSGTTDTNGRWATTFTSTVPGAYTLLAKLGTSVALNGRLVVAPAAADRAHSSVSVRDDGAVADGVAGTTLAIVAQDRFGNPIPGLPVSVDVGGDANVLDPGANPTTDELGSASVTVRSIRAAARRWVVNFGNLAYTGELVLVPGAPDGTRSTISFEPASGIADGTPLTVTVTARDAKGNSIPFLPAAFSSSRGVIFDEGAGSTDVDGRFSCPVHSTVAGTPTISATLGGTATATATVRFAPGPVDATRSTITSSNAPVVANDFATANILFTARDAQGNGVPGVTVGMTTTATDARLSATAAITDATGNVSFTATRTVSQPLPLTVQVLDGVAVTANIPFSPDAPYGPNSRLTIDLARVPADGTSRATFTVLVRDSRLNPVDNRALVLTIPGTNLTLSPGTSVTTDANGLATVTVATRTTQTVTASATIGGQPFSASTVFYAGNPSATQSSVTIDKTIATADGNEDATVSVIVRDSLGNPVPGAAVTLDAQGPVSFLVQPVSLTDDLGFASGTVSAPTGSLGTRVITASANGTPLATQVSVEFRAVKPAIARGPTMLTAAGLVCRQHTVNTAVNANKLAIDPGYVVYAVLDCGAASRAIEVWTSTDGAQTFRRAGSTGLTTNSDTEYAIAGGSVPQEAFLLAVTAGRYTVLRTVNAGATWTTYASRAGTYAIAGGASLVWTGTELVVAVQAAGGYAWDRWPSGTFSTITNFGGTYLRPDALADGTRVFYASDSGGAGGADVYRVGGSATATASGAELANGAFPSPKEYGLGGNLFWAIPGAGDTAYARPWVGLGSGGLRSYSNMATGPLSVTARAAAVGPVNGGAFAATIAGPQLFVQYATPAGSTFSAAQTLTNTASAATFPAIVASPVNGVAVVTWPEPDGRIRYAITAFSP